MLGSTPFMGVRGPVALSGVLGSATLSGVLGWFAALTRFGCFPSAFRSGCSAVIRMWRTFGDTGGVIGYGVRRQKGNNHKACEKCGYGQVFHD